MQTGKSHSATSKEAYGPRAQQWQHQGVKRRRAHQVAKLRVGQQQEQEDERGTGQTTKGCGQGAGVDAEYPQVAHLACNLHTDTARDR